MISMRGENWRFWIPAILLAGFAVYSSQHLIRVHLDPQVPKQNYEISYPVLARRGSIYSAKGENYPFAKSVPFWEYFMDPVSLTNRVVRRNRKERPRTREEIVGTIAKALKLDAGKVMAMATTKPRPGYRHQTLGISSDPEVYRTLTDSGLVSGIGISDRQVRQYLHGRYLAHVLGGVNAGYVGSSGLEQRYNRDLTGTPGMVKGLRDAFGNELYDKRKETVNPIPGADLFLTIDHNIQFETEDALHWGVKEFGASYGWSIVMDVKTGAVLAMASLPDFDPAVFGRASGEEQLNRAVAMVYEPGSVMKVITLASAIEAGFASPNTRYGTARNDPRYYKLPGDGSHVWEPTMTLKEAIVHSSNIVIGKLGYDFGPQRLYEYMRRFGFGEKTGIDLPGEEIGILKDPNRRMWDKASWSRAAIGQFVAVTAIQLASAYQAIANDGLRMKPYVVDRIVASDGTELYRHSPEALGRPISAKTARTMREIMLDVASAKGTARRAAIRGYSVAGKTGTAQKRMPGIKGYAPGLYRATFCGIVPATEPQFLVLTTLDFNARTKYHQGGNAAGPVFKRIATATLRYLMVEPDRPDELVEFYDDDEFDKIVEERAKKYGIIYDD